MGNLTRNAHRDVHQDRREPHEFEKGKGGVAVPSKDKLPRVVAIFIEAVRIGELNDLRTSEQAATAFKKEGRLTSR